MSNNKKRKYELDTWFDRFPIEIIFLIFEYLSSNDILYSYWNFNQRFNNLLMQQQQFLRSLELPTSNLDYWKQILSTIGLQIKTLIINNDNLSLPLNLFSNLKSIILSSAVFIDFKLLDLILKSDQFKTLRSLKTKQVVLYEYDYCKDDNSAGFMRGALRVIDPISAESPPIVSILDPPLDDNDEKYLFEKVFTTENKLETFEYLPMISCHGIRILHNENSGLTSNLHSLTLKLIDFREILRIIKYTPNLKYLNIIFKSVPNGWQEYESLKICKIQLEKLYLTFDCNIHLWYRSHAYFQLKSVIKIFSSSLKCLSLNLVNIPVKVNDFPFNGITLQEQLLESMIYLKEFYFYMKIDSYEMDMNTILSTFKNQFWFDHNWYVGMHRQYLYTLPFHYEQIDFYHINDVKSTNNDILINNPRLWYNVTSVNLIDIQRIDSNLLKFFKIKIPKLKSITIDESNYRMIKTVSKPFLIDNDTILRSVTTCRFNGESLLTEIKWLIDHLPNLKHFILDSSSAVTGRRPEVAQLNHRINPCLMVTPLDSTDSLSSANKLVPLIYEQIHRLDISQSLFEEFAKINYVYFPNVEYLVINDFNLNIHASLAKELLSKMKKLKTIFLYLSAFYDDDVTPCVHDRPLRRISEEDIFQFLWCTFNTFTNNYELKRFPYWIKISKKFQ